MLSRIITDVPATVRNIRLASCVVYKNDIISFGINSIRSHPFQARFGKNRDAIYLHAETCAIKNALKHISLDELSKSSLYVCRVKYDGPEKNNLIFGTAKPCSGCQNCISTFGIRKVFFTLDNQSYSML